MAHTDTPGSRIRDARRKAGMSQVQLAAAIGSTQRRISAVENGTENASLERLYSIAVAIGCRPSDLDERLTDNVCGKSDSPIGEKLEDR